MKNYIFITKEGYPMPIADRLRDEGKNVLVGLVADDSKSSPEKEESRRSLYRGILEVQDGEDLMGRMERFPDKDEWFVMFDYGDLWPYSERVMEMGFTHGVFPTEELYELEDNRKKGKEFAKKNYPDIKVAEAQEFNKVDDAIRFLEEQEERIFVLKSEGSNAETVVPSTNDSELATRQIIGALQSEGPDYESGGFTLEEKIKNPIEISPVMVFWNGVPLFSLVEIENKPMGSGNIGRLTGGCQNLTLHTRMNCRLNQIAFPEAIHELAKKQTGISIFDAGLLFDGKQFCFTEFCAARWGWDGIFSEIAMSSDSRRLLAASRHFDLICEGRSPITWQYGAAVRMFQTLPDPNRAGLYKDGYTVDWLEEQSENLWFYTLKKEKGRFVSVGYEKDFGVGTGCGSSWESAIAMAYRATRSVAMTGLYFRPKFDFLSKEYFTSIPNRYNWLVESDLL